MKNLKILSLIFIILFAMSCSKNDDASAPAKSIPQATVYSEQNPLDGYLVATGFNESTFNSPIILENSELGFSFIPTVKGKINAIILKIPSVNTALRVTIWEKVSGAILRTETINVTNAGMVLKKDITPLELVKNKEYVISFNSSKYYGHEKSNQSNATYPVTVGDIKITSFAVTNGSSQVIPNIELKDRYLGDCSFNFQRTE